MTTRTVAPRPAMRRTRAVPSVVVKSAATDEIVEKLKGITLLEASELVKVRLQINEFFSSPTTSSWYNARMG